MKHRVLFFAILFAPFLFAQNALFIPDTLSGVVDGNGVRQYQLNVQTGSMQFFPGQTTPTYGFNGNFLGPTIILQKDDSVQLNVTNNLNQATTVHWHGLHVAPMNDGGPHQSIGPGITWSPSFKVRNEASTFWYHPHGEMKTEIHVTKGLAGMIILRDDIESSYTLPRNYGVDDFPLIVQSKAFDVLTQLATATHEDSVNMVNGTINPFLTVPQQVVRFRLLNGNADRTYLFGLENNQNFHIIGSDGGLLSAPVQTNRVRLSPGERMEILVDFSAYALNDEVNFKSFSSELTRGIIGADSVGTAQIVIQEGYYSNPLNGADFNVLKFVVGSQTTNPVTTIPLAFAPKIPLNEINTEAYRSLVFAPDTQFSATQSLVDGPFFINGKAFNMDSINIITYLNNTEVWTLTNETMVAHPFHIHDIEFFVLDINGQIPPPEYRGLKDVILVQPNDTVRFITKFETFTDNHVPYMYHCHLLHHEDEGMMGSFLVVDWTQGLHENEPLKTKIFPNPTNASVRILANQHVDVTLLDALGKPQLTLSKISDTLLDLDAFPSGVYFLELRSKEGVKVERIVNE